MDASKFDLICEGVQKIPGRRGENVTIQIKVDLETNQWCGGTVGYAICNRVKLIHEITDSDYIFEDERDSRRRDFSRLDRQTGKLYRSNTVVGFFEGQCQKVEFSGFPEAKF